MTDFFLELSSRHCYAFKNFIQNLRLKIFSKFAPNQCILLLKSVSIEFIVTAFSSPHRPHLVVLQGNIGADCEMIETDP